jgi:hypothetical protein
MGSGSPSVWTLLGILPIIIGSISLYQEIRSARPADLHANSEP